MSGTPADSGYTVIETPPCPHCDKTDILSVPTDDLQRYQAGATVVSAFPRMPREVREQLITGTHPQCWEPMLGPEPQD